MRYTLTMAFALVPLLALAQSRPSHIKRTNPATLSKPAGYTHVVEVSGPVRTIYIAGQVATDKDGNVVGVSDMKTQADRVFKNLEAALTAAGATFADVAKTTIYTTDVSQVQAIRDARQRFMGDAPPASTLVQVVHLARPEFMLEIEAIAVVPQRAQVVPVAR
jgi:enamine deaminase RidA (YjgF/YER057c/UK114 family)